MSETMIRKNHMDVLWHEYTDKEGQNLPIVQASLTEKASIIGRAGIILRNWCVACAQFYEYSR